MACRAAVRTRLLAASLGALLVAAPARATDTGQPRSNEGTRRQRLDLGLYDPPYGMPGQPPTALRFDEWVDVEGAPARGLEETMAVWWKHFDLGEQAVYGRGYYVDPRAKPNAVNLLPVLEKLYDTLKKR
jgi:hypothetical protein